MRLKLFLIISLFLYGCIKTVNLKYRTPPPSLVVEGLLLTDSTPCQVILSYSGIFNNRGGQLQNFIDDATVYVHDDAGDSVLLTNEDNGTYLDAYDEMRAQTGRSYFITINLSNGERYASTPEKIVPVPQNMALDSIGQTLAPHLPDLYAATVSIKLQDPSKETNYYRWISSSWIPRKATGIPCGTNLCDQWCYQMYIDDSIRILSDAGINGSEIRFQNVNISPYYIYGLHYITVKQLSLTPQAYQFWNLYVGQTQRSGTIFDPLPAPLQGNIYNVNDTTQLALGYFEASDVYSLKLILFPEFVDAYYTLAYVTMYIYPNYGKCWDVYPNAIDQTPPPPGYDNTPQIIYNVHAL